MSDELPCVEIAPTASPASGAVIWMHGLGADGHDFEPIVPMLGLSHVRFVFPHAPRIPVTINFGMIMRAWYDIRSVDRLEGREDEPGVRSSAIAIERLLQREYERGLGSDRVVLAGFSQGGAMALHVGLRHGRSLGGIVSLSGYLVLQDRLEHEADPGNRNTPILLCHGAHDPLVPVEAGRLALAHLAAAHWPVTLREFPIQHEVSVPEIQVVGAWLRERLPP